MARYKIFKDDNTLPLNIFVSDRSFFEIRGDQWEASGSFHDTDPVIVGEGLPTSNTSGTVGPAGPMGPQGPIGLIGPVGPVGPQGPVGTGTTTSQDPTQFVSLLQAAFNNSTALNWTGGDVTLTSPIVLQATSNRIGFSLNMNDAKITCAFNDTTKYAITFLITDGNLNIREFAVKNVTFGGSNFAGGLLLRCQRNDSWIYSFNLTNVTTSNHTGHAIWLDGSVFECELDTLRSTGGQGLFRATTNGALDPNGQKGLPSAMVGRNWRPRDFNGHAVLFDGPAYNEPFDLRLTEGYFVTGLGTGLGICAPSGITLVEGVGFENLGGGAAIYCGYRGGRFINCQASNPRVGSTFNPPVGMAYLVYADITNNGIVLDGCSFENYLSGTGLKLANVRDLGGARIMLNPSRSNLTGTDIDTNVPSANFLIANYSTKV